MKYKEPTPPRFPSKYYIEQETRARILLDEVTAGKTAIDLKVIEEWFTSLSESDRELLLSSNTIYNRLPELIVNLNESEHEVDPPKFSAFLLRFLPKAIRENLIGDLYEEYAEVHAEFGKRKADWWFCYQVAISFLPLLRQFFPKWKDLTRFFWQFLAVALGLTVGLTRSDNIVQFVLTYLKLIR